MFTIKNGVYLFKSKVGVEWVAYSLESAIHLYAIAHSIPYREAMLLYERA